MADGKATDGRAHTEEVPAMWTRMVLLVLGTEYLIEAHSGMRYFISQSQTRSTMSRGRQGRRVSILSADYIFAATVGSSSGTFRFIARSA